MMFSYFYLLLSKNSLRLQNSTSSLVSFKSLKVKSCIFLLKATQQFLITIILKSLS